MSGADSLYNLQFIREFCDSCLKSCCHLALEDMLYIPQELEVICVYNRDGHFLIGLGIINYLYYTVHFLICSDQLAQLSSRTARLV